MCLRLFCADSIVTFGLVEFEDLNIEEELAKGSYGIVYAAQWRGYQVAVKMLDDKDVLFDSDNSDQAIQSDALVQEIRVFQELHHDNIVTFIG